jgi:hypothetical protein
MKTMFRLFLNIQIEQYLASHFDALRTKQGNILRNIFRVILTPHCFGDNLSR